jgi:hypothetical protein
VGSLISQNIQLLGEAAMLFTQLFLAFIDVYGDIHIVTTKSHVRVQTFLLGKLGSPVQEITQRAVIFEFIAPFEAYRSRAFLPLLTQ